MGIIHTTNYNTTEYIFNHVKSNRLIYNKMNNNRMSNEEMFNLHRNKTIKNSVLISPSLSEGISLDDDLSRFQIIVKLPFLNLDNYRNKIKMQENNNWYISKMWVNLMQASGRSTRSNNDYSVTYILDSSFRFFLDKYSYFLPNWFLERII
jgi:Rad3-related DNA helicase